MRNSSSSNKKEAVQQDDGLPKVDAEANLQTLNITLPTLKKPLANYVHTVRTGNLVYTQVKVLLFPMENFILENLEMI